MPDFETLFAPDPTYPYFARAAERPFEAQPGHFSLVDAGWLADCALLVYLPETKDVQVRLEQAGFRDVRCIGFERPGAQAFVAQRDEGAVVCFRGTEVDEWQDLLADASFVLTPDSEHGKERRMHRGFLRSLDTIWSDVASCLTGGDIWFTGHSLGAALATLAADRLPGVPPVYTFGSPRVGDKNYRQTYRANAYRFVNNNDMVTTVPPGGPFSAYRHVGDLKYFDASGRLGDDSRWWSRFKASLTGHFERIVEVQREFRSGDFDAVPLDQLADHSPRRYAENVWANLQTPGS